MSRIPKLGMSFQATQEEYDSILRMKEKGFTIGALVRAGIYALEERLKERPLKPPTTEPS